MQLNPTSAQHRITPAVASELSMKSQKATCETCQTAAAAVGPSRSPSPSTAISPTAPAEAQPADVDAVTQALDPQDQGIAALEAVVSRTYAFESTLLQMHRHQAEVLVQPWGLRARVQAVVRAVAPDTLANLAEALRTTSALKTHGRLTVVANMLGAPLPEVPAVTRTDLDPDLQLLRKLNPKVCEEGVANPMLVDQARQLIHQSFPGGVARALEWLDSPAYPTLVTLERQTLAALEALPEAVEAADALARQMAPAQLLRCDEALKEEPRDTEVRRVRADLRAKIDHDHAAAIADLTEVVDRDGLEDDYAKRGASYAALGQWEAAERDYGRAALFSVGSDRSLRAYLQLALRSLDAQHPTLTAAPLAQQARHAMLVLGLHGFDAAAPAIEALKLAAPEEPAVEDVVALAATFQAPEVALPPAASFTPTPLEEVGPIAGQPMVHPPVFQRVAARIDVTGPLITRTLASLQEELGLFPSVLERLRLHLFGKAAEFTQGTAESLQKLCTLEEAHAIEGLLQGPWGDFICRDALPLGERVHSALQGWLREIGDTVADIRVPRDLRGQPLRKLLQALNPEAASTVGGTFGVQCDLLVGQVQSFFSSDELQALLAHIQTEPFLQLCVAYRHVNDELFVAVQRAFAEVVPTFVADQQRASDERLEADPNDVEALTGRAMARMTVGDLDNAATDIDRLIELHPTAHNYMRRAALWLAREQGGAAAHDAQQAVRLAPRAAASFLMRSQTHLACGESADAVQDAMHARLLAVSADESMRAQMALNMAYQAIQSAPPTAA